MYVKAQNKSARNGTWPIYCPHLLSISNETYTNAAWHRGPSRQFELDGSSSSLVLGYEVVDILERQGSHVCIIDAFEHITNSDMVTNLGAGSNSADDRTSSLLLWRSTQEQANARSRATQFLRCCVSSFRGADQYAYFRE